MKTMRRVRPEMRRVYPCKSLTERFNDKWIPEPNSGCWLWTGATMIGGYGMIFIRHEGHWETRRTVYEGAHRISWKLSTGREIPKGMDICHRCDTPICVNPDHLFLATPKENTHDSIAKGRLFAYREKSKTK